MYGRELEKSGLNVRRERNQTGKKKKKKKKQLRKIKWKETEAKEKCNGK